MSRYELCVVVNPSVDDETRQATIDGAKEMVERFGGTIAKVDEWGKRRLA